MHYLESSFINRAVTFDKEIEWSQKVKVLFSNEDLKVAVLFFLLVKIPRF